MNKILLILTVILCSSLSTQAIDVTFDFGPRPTASVIISDDPPAPRPEVVYEAPSRDHVWIPGHWMRQGRTWEWYPGYWEYPPQRGASWIPGKWERSGHGWYWVEGHWKHEQFGMIRDRPTGAVIIEEAPPAPRTEVVYEAPSRDHVWIQGHWIRQGHSWEWYPGYWEHAPKRDAIWIPGKWEKSGRGWFWIEGSWKIHT
jgi:hypothetical protein